MAKKGTGTVGMVELVYGGWNSKLECYGFIDGGCSMESDGLLAEGEFLVLFGLYQEHWRNEKLR